jgi:DNA modification methylase
MEALREMPDNAFDLACVDPPYGDALANGLTVTDHLHSRQRKNNVTRTGGTWADKFGKKS